MAGAGGQGAPQRLLTGKFLLTYQEKKRSQGKKENCKREGGKLKMEGGKWKSYKINEERTPFFFFFFFASHFSKPPKFVLDLPKWKFSAGKKIRKNGFAPSEKFSSYAPAFNAKYGIPMRTMRLKFMGRFLNL